MLLSPLFSLFVLSPPLLNLRASTSSSIALRDIWIFCFDWFVSSNEIIFQPLAVSCMSVSSNGKNIYYLVGRCRLWERFRTKFYTRGTTSSIESELDLKFHSVNQCPLLSGTNAGFSHGVLRKLSTKTTIGIVALRSSEKEQKN